MHSFFLPPGSMRRCLTALCFFWCWSIAGAQVLDRIDVVPGDKEAEFVVRFGANILYQRHAPQNEGSLLRVFLRLVGSDIPESEVMQQTIHSPRTARLPTITVLYPELVNGMLVTFSRATRYAVRPGSDGRSIVITVPMLPPEKPAVPAAAASLPGQALKIVTAETKLVSASEAARKEPTPRFSAEPKPLALPESVPRFSAEPKRVPGLDSAPEEAAAELLNKPKPVPLTPVMAGPGPIAAAWSASPVSAPEATAAPVVPEKTPPQVAALSLPRQAPAVVEPQPVSVTPVQVQAETSAVVPLASSGKGVAGALPKQPEPAAEARPVPIPVELPRTTVALAPGPVAAPAPGFAVSPPMPSAAPEATASPASPVMSQAEVESLAREFLDEARRAIGDKDFAKAINRLNRILGLPRSDQTEPAQGLIGEARELNGEFLKAKAEYELYVKLFPTGPAAARVKERLAALPHDTVARANASKPLPKEAGPGEWTYFGSLSSYYYTGKSQIETLTPPPPGELTFNKDTLSLVDQKSLITSINLNARRRDAFSDTRIVYRDTRNQNYLLPDRGYSRVYSAYIDHNDRKEGYYVRAGRQNPNGMGVLERFDGIQAGYNLNPDWRVNGVAGDAMEFGSPFKKSFHGASIELMPRTGIPGMSVYAIQQTLDGYLNRRALGTELRYFDGHTTAYGMVDYDVLYKGINIALLQGNYLTEDGTNYFMVLDHRRAPSLSLTNALPGASGLSLKEMISAQDIETVRQQAMNLSAMSDMFSVGVTHPLTPRWQVGVDYRLSQISATAPVDAVIPLAAIGTCLGTVDTLNNTCVFSTAAQQGGGKNHVVSFQAIGNSLLFANAVGVGNISLISAPTYSGQASSVSYVLPLNDQWRFDLNLRYYTQKDKLGATQNRVSPSFKASWQWQNSLYLEGEFGREISKSVSEERSDRTDREYMYMGLRWDFR